jgi:hypothetical protein
VAVSLVEFGPTTEGAGPSLAAVVDTAPAGVAVSTAEEDNEGRPPASADFSRFGQALIAHVSITTTGSTSS